MPRFTLAQLLNDRRSIHDRSLVKDRREEPMLGGIKVKGDDGAGVPLFRILARRWKSLAPVKRKRVQLASMSPADEQPESPRKWISKPRLVAVVALRRTGNRVRAGIRGCG